jgi:predicted CoA-binding protein
MRTAHNIAPVSPKEQSLLQKIRSLPADKIAEIEDFIDFVRYKNEDLQMSRAAAKFSEAAFQRIWDNPEDDAYDSL